MKAKMNTALLLAAMTVFSTAAHAASVPWIGVLDSTHPITIPAGKVLLIQHMTGNYTQQAITCTVSGTAAGGIGSGSFSGTLLYTLTSIGGSSFTNTTLQLGPGMSLSINTTFVITVCGTAMDIGDFIAAASPVVRGISTDGAQLAAVVDSRTTAPTKTTGETSTDLQTWTTAGVTVAKSSSNPRISKVTAAVDAPKKFLRAKLAKKGIASTTD